MNQYLFGILTALSAAIALFFLKFARESRDRFFAFFAAAFAVLAADWFALAWFGAHQEARHLLYLPRLLAFLLIIAGIVEKNRARR